MIRPKSLTDREIAIAQANASVAGYSGLAMAYAEANKNKIEKLAGRFAAKEAILKLMGTGWRGKIAWTDIEVINNSAGQPEATLCGEVKKIADKLGIKHISVSITHTANFAIASAVALAQADESK